MGLNHNHSSQQRIDPRECPNRNAHAKGACATCGLIMDYPTAFAFADTVPIEGHHERCSKRAGMLCDCDVVNAEYTRRKAVLDGS